MMKLTILFVLFGLLLFLVGCGEPNIYYQGKYRPMAEVEEILSDTLEVENPNLDLNVNIYTDIDN